MANIAPDASTIVPLEMSDEVEARAIRFADRPIRFESFLDLNTNSEMELVGGVMVKKMAAQWEHERLLAWLFWLLYGYAKQKHLGVVAGSRTAIRVDDYHGRVPDLLFVRQDRTDIIRQRAIYGAPDLVIELISPNDRPSDIIGLETDYRSLGVEEVVFIDARKRQVRQLRKRGADYEEIELTHGAFILETVAGFELQVEWLFSDPRPDEYDLLNTLLSS